MKQYSKLLWILIILGSFVVSSLPANAGAYVYAGKRKKINCAIVGVPGATQPLAATSGVGDLFYRLDQRIDMKPAGWSFENPLAPGTPSTGLPKSDAAYWVIDLSTVRDLSMMNVLYLPASSSVVLDDNDREKLRKFVDGGGVLWIDNAASTTCLTFTSGTNDTFFIKDLAFQQTSGYDYPASRHHPLLTVPYWITEPEIMNLGANYGKCSIKQPALFGSKEPFEFDMLLPVVIKGSMGGTATSIGALAYGSGRIVATSNFVGRGCYMNYPYSLPSLKFAYNVIAWASSWTHLRKDPRHSGASIDTVGGTKLINSWTLPGVNPNGKTDTAPVIYKNVVFYSSGTKVYALDLRPQDDLDQDGNPDDGIQGLPSGMPDKGQDILWVWDCVADGKDPAAIVSSPTVVTAMDPCNPNATIDAVLVMTSSGTVYMLNAFPPDTTTGAPKGRLAPKTAPLPIGSSDRWLTGTPTDNPCPPIYENGWLYAVGGDGLLYAYSPALECWDKNVNKGAIDSPPFMWELPTKNSGTKTLVATPRSGPSFGYVENDGGGTLVGMIYWFTSPLQDPNATTVTGERNDHILGVPVMVSNDRLKIKRIDSTTGKVECQVTYTEGFISPVPKPRIWYKSASGSMVAVNQSDIEENKGIGGAVMTGTITFRPSSGAFPPDALIYATYGLNYGQRAGMPLHIYSPRIRQPLEPRTGTSPMPATSIAGTPAMGPDSMIYVNGTRDLNSSYGGSVYGIFNDGNTQLTKWHYFLHSGLTSGVAGTSAEGLNIPGVIMDGNTAMISPMPYSSPVVSGDKVFVTVSGTSGGPKGALLCFKANSDFVIRITESAGFNNASSIRRPKPLINETTNREMLVKVWQPNLLGSSTFTVNPLIEAVPVPKDMIDYQKGTITIDNFDRLKIRSAGDPTQTNTLSPSLPVWVFLDNVEVPIDFSTWGPAKGRDSSLQARSRDAVDLSGWNNLLWYYVIPESTVHNSPVVIGDRVYVVADDGKVYALNAETGETAATATAQKPEWDDKVCSSYSTTQNTSIAGSNGALLIPGADGLYAYTNATTLVTDSNRIAEIDGSGALSWALDSIMWPENLPPANGDPPAVRTGPINKPARVKYIDGSNLLLVNSGANQVARIDKSGAVGIERFGNKYFRWLFDQFSDPRRLLRPGQSTRLQGPTDAIMWQELEGTELVAHCLIADSGNHRVVDLVYRILNDTLQNNDQDPESDYYLPELNWVSKTDSMYDQYVYNSLQMVPVYKTGTRVLNGCDVWAAISTHHTGTGAQVQNLGRGGAIVDLQYRVKSKNGWDYGGPDSGTIVKACDRVTDGGNINLLSNPRCFELFQAPAAVTGTPEDHILIADDNGVFEVSLATSPPSVVVSPFTDSTYRGIPRVDVGTPTEPHVIPLGAPLVANSVQRLPNGNWLITNGFMGMYKDAGIDRKFTGEVFELVPGSNPQIVWSSPGLEPIPPGDWKQTTNNSYNIQQPRSAFRRY